LQCSPHRPHPTDFHSGDIINKSQSTELIAKVL
jgi:hypothetical protein